MCNFLGFARFTHQQINLKTRDPGKNKFVCQQILKTPNNEWLIQPKERLHCLLWIFQVRLSGCVDDSEGSSVQQAFWMTRLDSWPPGQSSVHGKLWPNEPDVLTQQQQLFECVSVDETVEPAALSWCWPFYLWPICFVAFDSVVTRLIF